jgi:nucleoporin SEH1
MLISTADEGSVRIWKKSNEGKWLEAAEVDSTKE